MKRGKSYLHWLPAKTRSVSSCLKTLSAHVAVGVWWKDHFTERHRSATRALFVCLSIRPFVPLCGEIHLAGGRPGIGCFRNAINYTDFRIFCFQEIPSD